MPVPLASTRQKDQNSPKINMGQTGDETIEIKEVTMMDKKGIDLIKPVLINGAKINDIADTGSQVSIISNDFAKN